MHGFFKGEKELFEYQAAQAKESARVVVKRGEVTTKVVTKYVKVAGETKTVTKTLEKEVVRYANPGYTLDFAWRWLHDAAAANSIPDSTGGIDGQGGAPTAFEALATVIANYAGHHACADRLDALQDWIREQVKVR